MALNLYRQGLTDGLTRKKFRKVIEDGTAKNITFIDARYN